MAPDPYQSPQSTLKDAESEETRPVRGILLAIIIDYVGTLVFASLAAIVYVAMLGRQGMPRDQIEKTITSMDTFSALGIASLVIGLTMSIIAGYYCVKISRARDYTYPSILAGIIFLIGVVSGWGITDAGTLLFLSAVGIMATIAGAYIGLNSRNTDSPDN